MRLYTSRLEEDKDPYLMYCNFQGIASIVPKIGKSKPLYSCSHKRLLTGRGNLLWYITVGPFFRVVGRWAQLWVQTTFITVRRPVTKTMLQ